MRNFIKILFLKISPLKSTLENKVPVFFVQKSFEFDFKFYIFCIKSQAQENKDKYKRNGSTLKRLAQS